MMYKGKVNYSDFGTGFHQLIILPNCIIFEFDRKIRLFFLLDFGYLISGVFVNSNSSDLENKIVREFQNPGIV